MPSVVKTSVEIPPRALREVDRFIGNPEILANAGGGCWKDILERKRPWGPNGLLIRPGEDWSPPGTGPINPNMKDTNKGLTVNECLMEEKTRT